MLRRARSRASAPRTAPGSASGLARGYDVMIEMDADLSHDPAVLPELVAAVEQGADLAIGSRYVPGGSIPDWKWLRRAISRGGCSTRAPMLGLSVHDATAGFRAYHRRNLSRIDLDHVRADGYGFQVEMTYLTERNGGRIVEVPIEFRDRTPRPVEDVEPHRGRGARCWSPGGASATGSPIGRRSSGAPRDTEGMALAEFTVAGALVESPDGLLLVRNQRRNGAHRLEHARRRDRRHRRVAARRPRP